MERKRFKKGNPPSFAERPGNSRKGPFVCGEVYPFAERSIQLRRGISICGEIYPAAERSVRVLLENGVNIRHENNG